MTRITYLAAPYSHPNPEVMHERVLAADAAAVMLMRQGFVVFSPLSQWHRAAQNHALPTNALHWREQNRAMLAVCDCLHVLKLDGWQDSLGVAMERQWATDKPQATLEPHNGPSRWVVGAGYEERLLSGAHSGSQAHDAPPSRKA